jgi:hypothetical protein
VSCCHALTDQGEANRTWVRDRLKKTLTETELIALECLAEEIALARLEMELL